MINIIAMVVFITLIALISSTYSSKFILQNITAFNQEMINEKSNILDDNIQQLEETINMAIEGEEVIQFILANESYQINPIKFLSIIKYLQNICSNNSIVKGICLIDMKNGIVLTDQTKLPLEEIPGYKEQIERYEENNAQNSFIISKHEDEKNIEYIKAFEPIKGEKKIYIIIKVNIESFVKNIMTQRNTRGVQDYIIINDSEVIYSNSSNKIDEEIKDIIQGLEKEFRKLKIGSQNLMIYKSESRLSNLSLVWIQDYTDLVKEANQVTNLIIIVSLIMIFIATSIIYVYSLYFYKPLKQLSDKIQKLTTNKHIDEQMNEYHLIEEIVNKLQDEKDEISKKYKDALPSFIHKTIYKLVTAPLFDEAIFEDLLKIIKKEMKYELNVLVISETEEKYKNEKINKRFLKFIELEHDTEGVYTELNAFRSLIIFNTNLSYEVFLNKVKDLKREIEQDGVEVTWCVSQGFKNRSKMHLVYSQALNTLESKFFKGKNTLIYEEASMKEYRNDYFNKEIERKLIGYVTEGKKEEVIEALYALTKDLSNSKTSIKYTCFIYFQICNNVIQSILESGIKMPKDFNEKEVFTNIFEVESIQELEQVAGKILNACMESFERRGREYSKSVEKAIDFISKNYMIDLSLDDVANAVFLSPGYLSNIFKEETGSTVFEYVTCIRITRAKELLLEKPIIKIKDISEQVGYNNVQSFIRYFKRYYGITPVAFRKEEIE